MACGIDGDRVGLASGGVFLHIGRHVRILRRPNARARDFRLFGHAAAHAHALVVPVRIASCDAVRQDPLSSY